MKRAVTGGAYRGPVALRRQARTIRFVQILLVLVAIGVSAFAVYAVSDGGSIGQTSVLVAIAAVALAAAFALSDGKDVRIPTPARLDELAGRAESAAIERAEDQPA